MGGRFFSPPRKGPLFFDLKVDRFEMAAAESFDFDGWVARRLPSCETFPRRQIPDAFALQQLEKSAGAVGGTSCHRRADAAGARGGRVVDVMAEGARIQSARQAPSPDVAPAPPCVSRVAAALLRFQTRGVETVEAPAPPHLSAPAGTAHASPRPAAFPAFDPAPRRHGPTSPPDRRARCLDRRP